jgi:poly(3-hydroxyalkanoate) synthetase
MSRINGHKTIGGITDEMTTLIESITLHGFVSGALYWNGMLQSYLEFLNPFLKASEFFKEAERKTISGKSWNENISDYSYLFRENMLLAQRAWFNGQQQVLDYHTNELPQLLQALTATWTDGSSKSLDRYLKQLTKALQQVVVDLPQAIEDIEGEYGFHFDNGGYELIRRTERMDLYQVLPTQPGVRVQNHVKPILIIHPYVLGANILAFLPREQRSYVHCFANQGIPTYVRIVRDIHRNPAVQIMTGEDDVNDTRLFAQILKEKHGKPVTLNGICQGGFMAAIGVLSGKLDGVVDALITCASPLDGSLSPGLREYLETMAPRFRSLAYATKTLPNGNRVVDGSVMSWVFKLKSLRNEPPIDFLARLKLAHRNVSKGRLGTNKTMAAVMRWLLHDRTDMPVNITELSMKSFSVPITPSGMFPFKLFGRSVNFDYIREKGIPFQICYGAQDALVEPASSLIATRFVDAEATEFPKGHAAILTSWSDPESEYALHKQLPNGQRGPVKFHLDLDEKLSLVGKVA